MSAKCLQTLTLITPSHFLYYYITTDIDLYINNYIVNTNKNGVYV